MKRRCKSLLFRIIILFGVIFLIQGVSALKCYPPGTNNNCFPDECTYLGACCYGTTLEYCGAGMSCVSSTVATAPCPFYAPCGSDNWEAAKETTTSGNFGCCAPEHVCQNVKYSEYGPTNRGSKVSNSFCCDDPLKPYCKLKYNPSNGRCVSTNINACAECTKDSHCGNDGKCCNGKCYDPHTEACCGLPNCEVVKTKGPGGEVCIDGCYIAGANTKCVGRGALVPSGWNLVDFDDDFMIIGNNPGFLESFRKECEPLEAAGALTTSCLVFKPLLSSYILETSTSPLTNFKSACTFFISPRSAKLSFVWGEGSIKAGFLGGFDISTRYKTVKVTDGTFRMDGEARTNGRPDGSGRPPIATPNTYDVTKKENVYSFSLWPGAQISLGGTHLLGGLSNNDWIKIDLGLYADIVSLWDNDMKCGAVLKVYNDFNGLTGNVLATYGNGVCTVGGVITYQGGNPWRFRGCK